MFEINQTVLYGSYGACRIMDIAEREFCGARGLYYILEPVFDARCTYFVAVDNEIATSRLRQVLPPERVRDMISAMPQVEEQWEDDPKLRKARYSQIISRGDRQELIGLIKALHSHQLRQHACGKKLNLSDEQSLRMAERMIHDEIALSLDLLPDQVLPYITSQLEAKAN